MNKELLPKADGSNPDLNYLMGVAGTLNHLVNQQRARLSPYGLINFDNKGLDKLDDYFEKALLGLAITVRGENTPTDQINWLLNQRGGAILLSDIYDHLGLDTNSYPTLDPKTGEQISVAEELYFGEARKLLLVGTHCQLVLSHLGQLARRKLGSPKLIDVQEDLEAHQLTPMNIITLERDMEQYFWWPTDISPAAMVDTLTQVQGFFRKTGTRDINPSETIKLDAFSLVFGAYTKGLAF
jgi:hypothetical protein